MLGVSLFLQESAVGKILVEGAASCDILNDNDNHSSQFLHILPVLSLYSRMKQESCCGAMGFEEL